MPTPILTADSPLVSAPRSPGDGREQAYAPTLPKDTGTATTPRQQAAKITTYFERAAAVTSIEAPTPPRLVRDWQRAVSRHPSIFQTAYALAARAEAGEDLDALVGEAFTFATEGGRVAELVADHLGGAEFRLLAEQLDDYAAQTVPHFDRAVERLQEAAAAMPSPLDSRPRAAEMLHREGISWDARGPLAMHNRTSRQAAEAAFAAEEAIGAIAALALGAAGDYFLSEVLAVEPRVEIPASLSDEDREPLRRQYVAQRAVRDTLASFASHGVPDLALLAVARGDLDGVSIRLAR